MVAVINSEIQACGTCVQLIANGEATYLDDAGDAHAKRMREHYGPGVMGLVNGNEELGFCSTPCEVCGDPDAGDRETVTELGEAPLPAVQVKGWMLQAHGLV